MSVASAVRAGESLVRGALWHEGRCTWIGPLVGVARDGSAPPYGALGPDLYGGTAGIAWFLASLYSSTGRKRFRRTAIGAMQHSLMACQRIKRDKRCTFYGGSLGVVFAAVELARRLDVHEFEGDARAYLSDVLVGGRGGAPLDLVTGTAGAVAALLVLARRLDDVRLLDLAVRIGDYTIRRAERSATGWSWRSAGESRRNLTGLSHGAAGVGYALLELFHATGDARYRDAAEHAFDYERSWFDADRENWPDFRGVTARGRAKSRLPCSSYWCHGAPGIALSRIRAWELLRRSEYRAEARAAIRTTRSAVTAALESDRGGFSLCHGLAGNAEVLYEGRDVTDTTRDDLSVIALATREAETRARLRRPDAPGLFLGLAGVGYLNLRLHDRHLPSLLLLRPEQFV